MNCLQFALYFSSKNPDYKIYYDGDHVINLRENVNIQNFLPLEDYGKENILNSFDETLYPIDRKRLNKYFENNTK